MEQMRRDIAEAKVTANDRSPQSVVDSARISSTKSQPKVSNDGRVRQPVFSNPSIPRIVVVGATGAGKSTTLNRLMTPVLEKRATLFREGAGAASETDRPQETTGGFFGREHDQCNFVDMPGLDDSRGAQEDTRHIREAAHFLISRPNPFAHLFVLVVNSASPRLSGSIRNMMTTFKQVFDAGGKNRFVDYLAIVFTKVEFRDLMYEDGDSDSDLRKRDDFECAFNERFHDLARDWAVQLAGLLGYEGDMAVIQSLRDRCVFTDHNMPKRRVEKLRDNFDFDVEANLERLFLWATRNQSDPFPLSKVNTEAQAKEDALIEQAEQAAKEAALAKQRELDAAEEAAKREKQLKAAAEAERTRLTQEAAARERRIREKAEAQRKAQAAMTAARENQLREEAKKAKAEAEKLAADEEKKRKEAEKKREEAEAKVAAIKLQAARDNANRGCSGFGGFSGFGDYSGYGGYSDQAGSGGGSRGVVHVRGYTRSNGTRVSGYSRRAPRRR